MTCKEQQEEELEVLHSIYEGDECFKEVNPTTFQYKYGDDGSYKSFNVEVTWIDTYPEESGPDVNLNTFYNKHILECVKGKIMAGINEQIPDIIGCAMTYTIFEWVKENLDDLLIDQPDAPPVIQTDDKTETNQNADTTGKKKEKKEQLTKNQKRKMFERFANCATGEKPRGWNWVDVVKHLSQSGSKE